LYVGISNGVQSAPPPLYPIKDECKLSDEDNEDDTNLLDTFSAFAGDNEFAKDDEIIFDVIAIGNPIAGVVNADTTGDITFSALEITEGILADSNVTGFVISADDIAFETYVIGAETAVGIYVAALCCTLDAAFCTAFTPLLIAELPPLYKEPTPLDIAAAPELAAEPRLLTALLTVEDAVDPILLTADAT
jgi:hypothetical protein